MDRVLWEDGVHANFDPSPTPMKPDDKIKGLKAKVHRSERYGTAQRIYKIDERIAKRDPRRTAEAFLKRFASDLGIDPSLKDLKFDKVKESILGRHVLFQQYHKRKSISGAWIRVDVNKTGKVFNVQNDLVPVLEVAKAALKEKSKAKLISRLTAERKAKASVQGRTKEILLMEQVYWPHEGVPVSVWKVLLATTSPLGEWRIYLDAHTGTVLEKRNMIKTARGRVFDPTPVAQLNDITLDPTKVLPANAYREVDLPGLKSTGYLDGPHVSTRGTKNRVKRTDGDFRFTRADRAFKEVMVYYHIDRAARHLISLGFTTLFKKPIEVDIDGTREDNSWYSPDSRSLTFGTGGIDDAEDAEVILHEYGHAIQDAQVPGWGYGDESASMGEGFGDFFAASFFYARKPKRMRDTIFNWDTIEAGGNPPCLRRLDRKKKYPRDMVDEVHDDGEIWSACLWELRKKLGRERAERLVIAHHELLTRTSTFTDAAHVMITTNRQLYAGKNDRMIKAVFVRRGIIG
ncbi:MAG: M36 family metallopeptidase [Flavobacteriales bacterium]